MIIQDAQFSDDLNYSSFFKGCSKRFVETLCTKMVQSSQGQSYFQVNVVSSLLSMQLLCAFIERCELEIKNMKCHSMLLTDLRADHVL